MRRTLRTISLLALLLAPMAPATRAADPAETAATALYERVSPSLVAVKYTWDFELRRQDLIGPGVVVSDDGLIMCPLGVFNMIIPDSQMKDFKIVIPSQDKDADEIEAVFVGRDERTNLAFLRPAPKKVEKLEKDDAKTEPKKEKGDKGIDDAKKSDDDKKSDDKKSDEKKSDDKKSNDDKKPEVVKKEDTKPVEAHKWVPIKFEDVPVKVGQRVWSMGVLPEAAAYKAYLAETRVAALLRGEVPQVLTTGGLTGPGSVVFNDDGKAIGLVNGQAGQNVFLNDGPNAMMAITNPPKFYVPASDFLLSLKDPPVAGKTMELPWIGVPQTALAGLNKDVADVYGLTNQPAVQIGDVIPDSPASKAGLVKGDVVVKMNGKALERGDDPDEVPAIMRRDIGRMKPGTEVVFSVIRKRGEAAKDITVKLETAPKPPNLAERYFADDLGFGVREMVFVDSYARRLPADAKGVVVSVIKPQSAAQTGGLQGNSSPRSDLIITVNGQAVEGLESFQKLYKAARKDKPKDALVLVVKREGREDTVRIEPPQ